MKLLLLLLCAIWTRSSFASIRPDGRGTPGLQGLLKGVEQQIDALKKDFKRFKEIHVPQFEVLLLSKAAVKELPEADAVFIENLEAHNEEAYELVMALQRSEGNGWKHVVTTPNGVTVEKRQMPTGSFTIDSDAAAGKKHAGVKTTGTIKAPPEEVFNLFINNDRVNEYNEHIVKIEDVENVMPPESTRDRNGKGLRWTKMAWSSSPRYGPLKARDFLSVVNFHKRDDGSYVIINRPGYLTKYPVTNRYARATVLLAGNIIEPHPMHPNDWTSLTQIAHVNPGGLADSKIAASIINSLCAKGPPAFFAGLERAAQKTLGRGGGK